jgi:hypothetical protein
MPRKLFEKGKSGNPFGRPPKSKAQRTVEERCRKFMDNGGWDIVFELAGKKSEWALDKIASYAYGKPVERNKLEISGPDGQGLVCLLGRAETPELPAPSEVPQLPEKTEN